MKPSPSTASTGLRGHPLHVQRRAGGRGDRGVRAVHRRGRREGVRAQGVQPPARHDRERAAARSPQDPDGGYQGGYH